MEHWGYHLIINASGCNDSIKDDKAIKKFVKQLVNDIDMVAYGKPQVIHFGTDNKMGYTLVQLIETSNICAHFVEETNDMYLDVFSCKDFNRTVVEQLVRQYFGATNLESNFLLRQAPGTNKLPYKEYTQQ